MKVLTVLLALAIMLISRNAFAEQKRDIFGFVTGATREEIETRIKQKNLKCDVTSETSLLCRVGPDYLSIAFSLYTKPSKVVTLVAKFKSQSSFEEVGEEIVRQFRPTVVRVPQTIEAKSYYWELENNRLLTLQKTDRGYDLILDDMTAAQTDTEAGRDKYNIRAAPKF